MCLIIQDEREDAFILCKFIYRIGASFYFSVSIAALRGPLEKCRIYSGILEQQEKVLVKKKQYKKRCNLKGEKDMLQEMMKNYVCSYIVIATGSVAIAIRILLGVRFGQLLKKTREIGIKKHEFNENVKNIFKVSYNLEMNVHNVDKFVDKYVYKQKIMGILLHTWEKICGQVTVLCLASSVLSVLLTSFYHGGQERILQEVTFGVFMWTLLITIYMLTGVTKKKEEVNFYLVEYLENVYAPRLKKEKEDPAFFKQYKKEMEQVSKSRKVRKVTKKVSKKNAHRAELERMKQELVEELKQERLANEEKRLLEKQKKREQEEPEETRSEKLKQAEQSDAIGKFDFVNEEEDIREKEEPVFQKDEKEPDTMVEEESQILQAILREYLGEI